MASITVQVTDDDKRDYREKGYWISPKLIDDEQIARLRAAHERVWAGDYDGNGTPLHAWRPDADPAKIRKFDNGWWINDAVRDVVTSPLLGAVAAELMDTDEVRLWHDQVIYKPGAGPAASAAGNVGWHQDYGYWQCSSTTNMVTAWIALQDTDLDNGGMMSIIGSHKWGLVPDSDAFFDQDMEKLKAKFTAQDRAWVEEPCILKAGQASFHHALTFHGSGPNRTNQPRLSVVAHLMPKGAAFRAGIQFHNNVKLLGPRPYDGQPFDNEWFPRLYARAKASPAA